MMVSRRSSVTRWPWKAPATRSTLPIAYGERANICFTPSSDSVRANWVLAGPRQPHLRQSRIKTL